MQVSVFGLGYVGCVSAACLAYQGHDVVGVDVDPNKVELVMSGKAPVVEERIGELTEEVVRSGKLRATTDVDEAIAATDISLVCVGTPSASNGSPNTTYLERVAEQIGDAITKKSTRHTVVFRSTMWPGTVESLLIPILEKRTGLTAGEGFGVAVNPEFLRESTSVKDYFDPGRTVIGELDKTSGDAVAELYKDIPGKVFRVSLGSAAMIKYLDNSWHAVKVGFGNEVGALAKAHGIDSHELIEVFLADEKLNLGPVYLRPGFAFGGSCLPKDLRGITYAARQANVLVPILEHVLPSNEEHLKRALNLVLATGARKIAVFGLSFKPGTDDMRESPLVELVERLIGKGYELKIYDANVSLSRLTGANKAYMDERLPHLSELLTTSLDEVKAHSEVAIVGTTDPDVFAALPTYAGRTAIDLVRIPTDVREKMSADVIGLAW